MLGDPEKVVIDGHDVMFYNAADSSGASWEGSCLSYSASAIPGGDASVDLAAVLLDFVESTLALKESS